VQPPPEFQEQVVEEVKEGKWEECQSNSDQILAAGLETLLTADLNTIGEAAQSGTGIYLFYTDEEYLYIGETLDLRKRLAQHLRPSEKSVFMKNYRDYLQGTQTLPGIDIEETFTIAQKNVYYDAISVSFGRKELEEYGIINLPAVLNRFQIKARRYTRRKEVDLELWSECQRMTETLLCEGGQILFAQSSNFWSDTQPPNLPGIYLVINEEEPVYIGETTNLFERYKTHSTDTYFSALRKNVGRTLFNAEFIKPKRFAANVDRQIDVFLSECTYQFFAVQLGRRELEEILINKFQPKFNRKTST